MVAGIEVGGGGIYFADEDDDGSELTWINLLPLSWMGGFREENWVPHTGLNAKQVLWEGVFGV